MDPPPPPPPPRRRIINWLEDCPELQVEVKDQEDRCNCWAIATAWAVAARYALERRMKVQKNWILSAQYLVDDFIRDRPHDVPFGTNGRRASDTHHNYPLDTTLALDYIGEFGIPFESHYPYTGKRDRGETKRDTTKLPKVFISGYTQLQNTNVGNGAKETVYGSLLRGPLLASIDLSVSFTQLKDGHVLRPEDNESGGSEFNPGSDDPSTDESTDTNNFSNDDPSNSRSSSKSGDDDPNSHDSGIHESGTSSHDSGSHESCSPDSSNHESVSQDSGSHESSSHASHASDDPGNLSHAIVIVGMDFDENYFLVLNSEGPKFGVGGVGKVDCSLIFDILEPHVNDHRNRGMRGPVLRPALPDAYSSKQERALKHLGQGRDIITSKSETIGCNVSAMGPGVEIRHPSSERNQEASETKLEHSESTSELSAATFESLRDTAAVLSEELVNPQAKKFVD